jgi:hypothetical protein
MQLDITVSFKAKQGISGHRGTDDAAKSARRIEASAGATRQTSPAR